jgi:transcriptional regulator with XRE-family HTH domain
MERIQKRFGRRVRELREARGWTQEQLGRAAGLDAKHVGVIERGMKSSSFDAVEKLAAALRVDAHDLFLQDARAAGAVRELRSRVQPRFSTVPRRELERLVTDLYRMIGRAGGVD